MTNKTEFLRRAVMRSGFHQGELADQLGVTRAALVGWLVKAEVPLNKLEQFCELVNIHPKEANSMVARLFEQWGK